ncbi:2-polyprenyl-6-methoxyphenol hydroxylase-like FAD-dependent oxidoreductase [Nocardia tenerifensis]|uniref:2-polyprenyl-6-methoxyphenol hydroxylase-like FAD-dependent oxidoreductase n=1 Tax=Nocardia tenerifensis TaxID=228006 RepID=A0A318JSG5_9NOCA|nr:FAD-dependent monooxygenase [Nocardia tenerifensis]PXX58059.1 2-polyprenyl-6-methoxyphenol hydroxylase-like FAD-dependent oxidoreductase [Nocardia tenerifensis]
MRVLISGASIAGPVLAYWLDRYGFEVCVVERTPAPRKTGGGHAVDLFGPAMRIVDRMGVAEQIRMRATGTDALVVHRPSGRPVTLDLRKLFRVVSDDHVEIMRDDLSEILYTATSSAVEYLFDDSIAAIADSGEVSFERNPERRFDVIVGADGLHSKVRALVFGPESDFTTWLGAYLAVFSVPDHLGSDGVMQMIYDVGRAAGVYSAANLPDARAGFFLRPAQPLYYQHRDVERQKQLLHQHFRDMAWEVPRLLGELDQTASFYFDSITQLRLDTWSRGRVAVVGDAAYCPGPAVGGSTSMAVVGAYTLAGELAAHPGDYPAAFAAYERRLADYVRRSRSFARTAAKSLIPARRWQLWAMVNAIRVLNVLPAPVSRAAAELNATGVRLHESIAVPDYTEFDPTR